MKKPHVAKWDADYFPTPAEVAERKAALIELEKYYDIIEKPIVSDINSRGYNIKSVWDFVNWGSGPPYDDIVPILLHHMKCDYDDRILEGLARSLARPWCRLIAWDDVSEYYESSSVPNNSDFKRGLAIALMGMAIKADDQQLLNYIKDIRHGDSRIALAEAVWRNDRGGDRSELIESCIDPFMKGYIELKIKERDKRLKRAAKKRSVSTTRH